MKCPADGTTLVMADRQGVEIDYCPQCRGVWLDRGELDKLIERAVPAVTLTEPGAGQRQAPSRDAAQVYGSAPAREDRNSDRHDDRRREFHRDDRYHDDDDRRPRRRKSFLSEIFDFD